MAMRINPASATTVLVSCSTRPCSSVSVATAWSKAPEIVPATGTLEEIAKLDRLRADDHLLAGDAARIDRAAQDVDQGDPVDGPRIDAEVDRECLSRLAQPAGKNRRHGRHHLAVDDQSVAEGADLAVAIGAHIDAGDPGVVGECAQRLIVGGRSIGRAAQLLRERGEDDAAAGCASAPHRAPRRQQGWTAR